MLRDMVTVAVLTREPDDDVQGERIACDLITRTRPEVTDPVTAADYRVSWFTSPDMPPAGLPVHDQDQLRSHIRDAGPEAVYMTVMVERA